MFPLQVEPLFDAHPKVRRSGLVGVPGPAGELPVLCVEVQPAVGRGTSSTTCTRHCSRGLQIPAWQTRSTPSLFKDALPVDPRHNSKIERGAPCQVGSPAIVGTALPQASGGS